MSYDNLGYDQLAFKASHNSYDRKEDLLEQLRWNPDARHNGGCRGLELDIVRHSDSSGGASESYFQVAHERGGEGPTLASYLADLLAFHRDDPGHGPVFLSLDIKSEEGSATAFPTEFDTYLTQWFDASLLFTPGRLLVDRARDLVWNVQHHGWPLLSELNGMFLFCLSGNETWKLYYSTTSPSRRLCFADMAIDADRKSNRVNSGTRVIANLHLYSDDYDQWKHLVPSLRAQRLLVRGFVLNSSSLWEKARSAGVNALTTDKVSGHEWAKVGSEPFAASAPQVP